MPTRPIDRLELRGSLTTVDLELGLFNVFLGASGVVKAAALEALGSAGFLVFEPSSAVLRGEGPSMHAQEPVSLDGGNLARAFYELDPAVRSELSEDMSAWFDSFVQFSEPQDDCRIWALDRFTHEKMPLSSFGDGALHALFALMIVVDPRSPEVVGIESFGGKLNPRLARALAQRLSELAIREYRQVVVTTHSALALDGLALGHDEIRLFVFDRDGEGHAEVWRVRYEEALTLLEHHGGTLGSLWVRGLLTRSPLASV